VSRPIVWSDAARALFQLTAPTAVSAGAGSGKTTCLVELCARLFSGEATGAPCDPAEVAAITFTDKAAAELADRLRDAVAERAGAAAAASGFGSDEARAWRLRLHGLERMAVGTIHGFAGRLLREHALEAGLDPGFEVADEETAQGWRRDAARAAVVAALDAGRPEARALAAAQGAGGRRAGLADAVADLARERATFGERQPIAPAPDRLEEALAARAAVLAAAQALLAARSRMATPSGVRALAELAQRAGQLDDEDRRGPLRPGLLARVADLADAVRGWRVGSSDAPGARGLKDDLVGACEAFLPRAAEALAGPQKRELCALVADAEARYAALKLAAGALDFDDLLIRARDLLRDDAGVRAELRGRLRALLVDEYQDVNALQQEIFELLVGEEGGATSDAPRPVLVAVGDLKQSIYRFRGADVAVFRGVLDQLGRAPQVGRVLRLTTNHRSGPGVLELVNEVFSRCMQPTGGGARPYELAFSGADRLVPARAEGQRPACEVLQDGEEGSAAERRPREARAIASRIQALVSGVAGVEVREADGEGERARRPRHGDVALLFRRLTQIGEYERALREAGIPYRLARGGGFYQAPEVRDLGELLASLSAPEDAVAWAALLRSPLCGLGDGSLFAVSRLGLTTLARRKPEDVVAELLRLHPDAARPWPATSTSTEADRLHRFLLEWHGLHALHDRLSLPDLLSRAVDRLDLEAAHLAAPDGERRLVNLRKALAMAARFDERGGAAAGFAARLRTMAGRPPREPEAELEAGDAVALLSVHQAKGLEWPIVFVPDLGATPPRDARRALRDPSGALAAVFLDAAADAHHPTLAVEAARDEARRAGAAESRRLLYVALTRARDRLVLSGEVGRGGGDTWRALVEAGLAARPDLALRVPLAEAGTFSVGPPASAEAGAPPEELPPAAAQAAGRGLRLAPAPLPAVRVAVTELAEHARCPRRVFLARHLGIPEPGRGGGPAQDDPDRATARGTLAHAMIAEVDLGAPPLERRAQLAAAATRRGYDPQAKGVRQILIDVTRFLESEGGRRLARAARSGALRREVPFLLRIEGDGAPSCYLVGAVDALVEERREVAVIDFKYAMARPGAADRYRLQLLAYSLAAARALPGRRVTASLQFLRGGCSTLDLTPSAADLRRFEREAPHLAAAAHAGSDLVRTPAELGRSEARCRAEGCGYVGRCYVGRGGVAPAAV
jgi:ATP-dependent helicase/nuclease subunit A